MFYEQLKEEEGKEKGEEGVKDEATEEGGEKRNEVYLCSSM